MIWNLLSANTSMIQLQTFICKQKVTQYPFVLYVIIRLPNNNVTNYVLPKFISSFYLQLIYKVPKRKRILLKWLLWVTSACCLLWNGLFRLPIVILLINVGNTVLSLLNSFSPLHRVTSIKPLFVFLIRTWKVSMCPVPLKMTIQLLIGYPYET